MKLYRVILIALFSLLCLGLNAQVFIGGGIGFSSTTDEKENLNVLADKSSSMVFTFSPNVGGFVSENLALGIELNFSNFKTENGIDSEFITKQSSIGINPYLRYYAWRLNKFSVFFQGNIGAEFSKSSIDRGNTISDGPKVTKYYVSVFPGLSYDLSDKLLLETSINFLSFGYSQQISEDKTESFKKSGFYLGAGLDNMVNIGSISIGAKYKF